MGKNNLAIMAQECDSPEKLLDFLRLLSEDFRVDQNGWENATIDSFLSAGIAWANDTGKAHVDYSIANPWGSFAKLLYMGKIYE